MKKLTGPAIFAALCSFAAFLPASPAQAAGGFAMHEMDFSLWCTEQQKLPYERCEKRLPKDIKAFDAYQHIIEKYEMKDVLSKQHTLSLANIKNAADSDKPKAESPSAPDGN